MKIGSSAPNRVDDAPLPKAADDGETSGTAATRPNSAAGGGPDSLVDVRLIASPRITEAKKPVRTAQEAKVVADEAARALKAAPKQAAQVAGNVRPESAAAAVVAPAVLPRQ